MPELQAPPLVVRDLGFRYNSRRTPAIEDINLQLEPGQVVLLAGSSGCGKTTLMRCVNGLIPHTYHGFMQGEIELYGKSVKGMGFRISPGTWEPCCRTRNDRSWELM